MAEVDETYVTSVCYIYIILTGSSLVFLDRNENFSRKIELNLVK